MPTVLLASASERRRSMMSVFSETEGVDVKFSVLEEPEPEPSTSIEVKLQVEASCMHKARIAALENDSFENGGPEIIVVSDTLVEDPDDSRIALGKPDGRISAASTLIRLSGRRHKVWSSTAIVSRDDIGKEVGPGWHAKVWTDFSIVEFDEIDEGLLEELIASESWVGKAGGYDLSGKAGLISRVVSGADKTVLGFSDRAFDHMEKLLL